MLKKKGKVVVEKKLIRLALAEYSNENIQNIRNIQKF